MIMRNFFLQLWKEKLFSEIMEIKKIIKKSIDKDYRTCYNILID